MSVLRLHHIGLATRSVERERRALEGMGAAVDGLPFTDAGLGISGLFIRLGDARLELLEEHEASGVLEPWLQGAARLYHVAYLCPSIESGLAELGQSVKIVRDQVPAVAFEGRPVTFVITPTLLLVELIQQVEVEGAG